MNTCPECQSKRVVTGKLVQHGGSTSAVFRPSKTRFATLSVAGGVKLAEESLACLDCGLVWGHAAKEELLRFLEGHCYESWKQELA
jgi:hypothetical protein